VPDGHLFVCFSSKDESTALEVVTYIEDHGRKCWISSRDVAPGQNYQEAIVHALEGAAGIVFLFSESSNQSGEIKKELSIGASISVPVFPLRLSPVKPSGALRYELATRQWIDLFPDRDKALGRLVATIEQVLRDGPVVVSPAAAVVPAAAAADPGDATVPSAPKARAAPEMAAQRGPLIAADSQEFEAIRALLARHIGPIAKVFVQSASSAARTPDEFLEKLGAHVKTPADRAAFVQAARARLAARS
jgi:hypothetical protein